MEKILLQAYRTVFVDYGCHLRFAVEFGCRGRGYNKFFTASSSTWWVENVDAGAGKEKEANVYTDRPDRFSC